MPDYKMDQSNEEKLKALKEQMKPLEEELRAARQSGDKERLRAAHTALAPFIEQTIKIQKEMHQ